MIKNKNHILYYWQYATYSCLNLIAMGTIFQTFMLECGVSESKVSFCVSALQVIQTLTMLLISKRADGFKNILGGIAICLFAYALQMSVMLFICLNNGVSVEMKYILLFLASIILNLFAGLYNILVYKQPYHIMDISDYGKISGQSGVIAGVLGVLLSAVITFAFGKFSYFGTMLFICVFGIVMAIVSGLISFWYEPVESGEKVKNTEKINIFRYKPFYCLLIPNFMRGVSAGIFNLIAVIGYYCEILDSATAAVLVTFSQIATLISCQTYSFIATKRKSGILCLVSSVVLLFVLPLMLVGNSKIVFVALYFVAYFFSNHIAYAVPVIVAENIDYNCLGQYTAWRMALFAVGISVGGSLVPLLLKYTGSIMTLLICGITMLPCGIGYYIFDKRSEKQ